MRTALFLLLLSGLAATEAHAYLPPSFYVYGRIAEQREQKGKEQPPLPGVQISVSRPLDSGTEETLGSITLPSWPAMEGGWPSLTLLFANEKEQLIRAVNNFGVPVSKETELLRASREQIAGMKEAPRPFYRADKRMGLKRYKQSYSWVHREGARAVWVEKDSFLPLKIEAPCPPAAAQLAWAKAGEGRCEMEFRNIASVRRGNPQSSRMLLWKDGAPLLFFSFERVVTPKAGAASSLTLQSTLPPGVQGVAETVLH